MLVLSEPASPECFLNVLQTIEYTTHLHRILSLGLERHLIRFLCPSDRVIRIDGAFSTIPESLTVCAAHSHCVLGGSWFPWTSRTVRLGVKVSQEESTCFLFVSHLNPHFGISTHSLVLSYRYLPFSPRPDASLST